MTNVTARRNELCPCGSGKKFKKCCLQRTAYRTDIFRRDAGPLAPPAPAPASTCPQGSAASPTSEANERVIRTTPEHPFYVRGKGWTPVKALQNGDLIRTEDGWAPVHAVRDSGQVETVYNWRVADFHTYFVGGEQWGFSVWAHNVDAGYDDQGRELFENGEPWKLESELKLGEALGIEPMEITDPRFKDMAREAGGRLKWAHTTDNRVLWMPHTVDASGAQLEVPHTVLTGGENVLSAGEARVAVRPSNTVVVQMDNHSGHYEPSNESLDRAAARVEEYGVNVLRRSYAGE